MGSDSVCVCVSEKAGFLVSVSGVLHLYVVYLCLLAVVWVYWTQSWHTLECAFLRPAGWSVVSSEDIGHNQSNLRVEVAEGQTVSLLVLCVPSSLLQLGYCWWSPHVSDASLFSSQSVIRTMNIICRTLFIVDEVWGSHSSEDVVLVFCIVM
jgi:hypothetical protein